MVLTLQEKNGVAPRKDPPLFPSGRGTKSGAAGPNAPALTRTSTKARPTRHALGRRIPPPGSPAPQSRARAHRLDADGLVVHGRGPPGKGLSPGNATSAGEMCHAN